MSNNKGSVKSKKDNDLTVNNTIQESVTTEKVVKEIKKPIYVEPSYGTDIIDYDDVHDEADIASALEMGFIAKALADHKTKMAPEKHPDFDGEHCLDCDTEIPEARLEMGRIRCVDCQTELEMRDKLKGKR